MAQIRVFILDHTGGTKTEVEVPDDVPMRRLLPVLVERIGLPAEHGGIPVSYRLDIPDENTRLGEDETLSEAEVKAGAVLSLLPEVTAGARGD